MQPNQHIAERDACMHAISAIHKNIPSLMRTCIACKCICGRCTLCRAANTSECKHDATMVVADTYDVLRFDKKLANSIANAYAKCVLKI